MSTDGDRSDEATADVPGYDPAMAARTASRLVVKQMYDKLTAEGCDEAAERLRYFDGDVADQADFGRQLCDEHLGGWRPSFVLR